MTSPPDGHAIRLWQHLPGRRAGPGRAMRESGTVIAFADQRVGALTGPVGMWQIFWGCGRALDEDSQYEKKLYLGRLKQEQLNAFAAIGP